jgi:vacuolar protein sorting-associated protein 29
MSNKAKELGVTLLISGHSHELKTSQHGGVYFLNPGSMTGAYSALKVNAVPSFMILEFKTSEIVIYEYSLVEGELNCVDVKIPRV